MVKFTNLVLLIIFVVVVLVFTADNPERVSIVFFGMQSIKLPISVIVFSSIVIGILIALVYHFYAVYMLKKRLKGERGKATTTSSI